MKELGSASYLPRVFDFFPKLARGHGAQKRYAKVQLASGEVVKGPRSNPLCNATGSCDLRNGKGDKHHNQAGNRLDWEESVGLRRGSKSTRSALHAQGAAAVARLDPKDFAALAAPAS